MNLKSFTLFWSILLLIAQQGKAQPENNTWIFGHHCGLDFNGGSPVFITSSLSSDEGAASVSDNAGNLLFYSDGNQVWNANDAVMPNGNGLLGNGPAMPGLPGSCTQGVAIVRFVNNTDKYYVFVLESMEQIIGPPFLPAYLRYSVVDMSLNGGLGDVVSGQKNIVVDSGIAEQMCVAKGDGCYCWLIVHSNHSAVYKSYKIDATGLHAAVASPGLYYNTGSGEMKISPDESKLAFDVQLMIGGVIHLPGSIELSHFNKATGQVSGTVLIDSINPYLKYGLSFSPDNSKLYSVNFTSSLVQYDITAYPDVTAINNSKVVLSTDQFGGMRLGPDNKIYITPSSIYSNAAIACINNPNLPGVLCNLNVNAIPTPPNYPFPAPANEYVGIGLGNPVVILDGVSDTVVHATQHIPLCSGDSVTLAATTVCDQYQWNTGSHAPGITVHNAGPYWVSGISGCAVYVDSFQVSLSHTEVHITENDTTICDDIPLALHARSPTEGTYLWNTGATTRDIIADKKGWYKVLFTDACGISEDSVRIEVEHCNCRPFIPNAFSPNNDAMNDRFMISVDCEVQQFSMSIYNRYGQRVFQSGKPQTGWDGTFGNKPCDAGTYYYYIHYIGTQGKTYTSKGDLTLLR